MLLFISPVVKVSIKSTLRFKRLSDLAEAFLGLFEQIFCFGVLSCSKSALMLALMLVNLMLYELQEYFARIKSKHEYIKQL